LSQKPNGLFEQALERLQEGGSRSTVYRTVVAAQGQFHDIAWHHGAVFDHGNLLYPPNRQNTGIRRVDDGRKLVNAEHSQVRNREGRTFPVRRLEFLVLCALRKILYLRGYMRQAFAIGKTYHGHQQSILDSYRYPDIHVLIVPDFIALP